MKYLVICTNDRDGSSVFYETDDLMKAVRTSNHYNELRDGNRYTVFVEWEG